MSQQRRTPVALEYGRTHRLTFRRARRIALFILLAGFAAYTVAWLRLASGSAKIKIDSGHVIFHHRLVPHHFRGPMVAYAFEPAYRIDRMIRPEYWDHVVLGPR